MFMLATGGTEIGGFKFPCGADGSNIAGSTTWTLI